MSKLEKRRLILYIVAVVLVYAIIKGLPLISDSLTKTYIASYGDLQIVDKTTAYFVRNERVYFAGNSGKVNSFIDQGELIQNGTTVMEIVGSHQGEVSDKFEYIIANNKTNGVFTTSYSNLAQGIVSYYADGYEETLTPNTMENISYTVLAVSYTI